MGSTPWCQSVKLKNAGSMPQDSDLYCYEEKWIGFHHGMDLQIFSHGDGVKFAFSITTTKINYHTLIQYKTHFHAIHFRFFGPM